MTSAMKLLQDLKKRLFKSKDATHANHQNGGDTKAKSRITKAFSKDEDRFMFI